MLAPLAGRIYDHAPQQNAVPLGRRTGIAVDIESSPIPDVRELSDAERALVGWMLEHGGAPPAFAEQLRDAYVVARCPCGCPSVDFAVRDRPPPSGPMTTVADFVFGDDQSLSGIFVFSQNGILAGIEVYALANGTPTELPSIQSLKPWDASMLPDEED